MNIKFDKLCCIVLSSAICMSASCLSVLAMEKGSSDNNGVAITSVEDNVVHSDEWAELFKEVDKIELPSVKDTVRNRVAEALGLPVFQDIIRSPKRVSEMNDQDLESNLIDAFEDTVFEFKLSKGSSPVPFEIKTEQDIEKDFIGLSYISSHCQDFRYYETLNYVFKIGLSCNLAKLYCIKGGLRSSQLRRNRKGNYESLKNWHYKNNKSIRSSLGQYAFYLGVPMDL